MGAAVLRLKPGDLCQIPGDTRYWLAERHGRDLAVGVDRFIEVDNVQMTFFTILAVIKGPGLYWFVKVLVAGSTITGWFNESEWWFNSHVVVV